MMAAGGSYDDEPMGDTPGMASGGIAAYANEGQVRHLPRTPGIPDVGIYRDTDVDTYKKLAWEAAGIRNKKAATGASMPKKFLVDQQKTSLKGIGDIEEVIKGVEEAKKCGTKVTLSYISKFKYDSGTHVQDKVLLDKVEIIKVENDKDKLKITYKGNDNNPKELKIIKFNPGTTIDTSKKYNVDVQYRFESCPDC